MRRNTKLQRCPEGRILCVINGTSSVPLDPVCLCSLLGKDIREVVAFPVIGSHELIVAFDCMTNLRSRSVSWQPFNVGLVRVTDVEYHIP